jgi:hypothetical protein
VRLHEELGATYAGLAPELFQQPLTTGLTDEFNALITAGEERALHPVADVDHEVAAALGARVLPPEEDAEHQIQRDAGSTRLRIENLVNPPAQRRRRLATRLVDAAEDWAASAPAADAACVTLWQVSTRHLRDQRPPY